ncbi:hypothetical protein MAM1_0020d01798 [Mucor ambiguus]|uniref:HTH APSES-type domain-containing protein n=1 Tax=Mucor ambiguus TaxID=91626 RepID=A0A0C9LRW5_9FUNG|nr:hypothetical protein MAM1_0020d01798 [Mucor ambiguus]
MQSSSRHQQEQHAHNTDFPSSSSSSPPQSHYTANPLQQSPLRQSDMSNRWQQNDSNGWDRSLSLTNNTRLSSINTTTASSPSLPPLPPVPSTPSLLQSRFYPTSSSTNTMPPPPAPSSTSHLFQPYPALSRSNSYLGHSEFASRTSGSHKPLSRPRLTTTLWEDESTICYQVDCRGICVARRQDNNMINGTKLLNVAGMSRGKRDGILKNERGRVVVKVGAMHLKGVWIPFVRAKALANQFKILDILYPIFSDDPTSYLYPSHLHQMNRFNISNSSSNHHFNNARSPNQSSFYKSNSSYPTSTSALDLLATARDAGSVLDDIVPQVGDTYGIYHHHQQQTRGSNNNDSSYNQHQIDHPSSATTTTTTPVTNVKSLSFLTDYSTAHTNHNSQQDSVQERSSYRYSQNQQANVTRSAASNVIYGASSQHNSYYQDDSAYNHHNMTSPIPSSNNNATAASSSSTSPSMHSTNTSIVDAKAMSKPFW